MMVQKGWLSLTEKLKSSQVPAWIFILGAGILFYLVPYSPIAFILFLISFLVLYKAPAPLMIKLPVAFIWVCVIMPLAGLQNSFYLDVATQVGIYVALALGLNIVVGFAGLLDLGYVAFLRLRSLPVRHLCHVAGRKLHSCPLGALSGLRHVVLAVSDLRHAYGSADGLAAGLSCAAPQR